MLTKDGLQFHVHLKEGDIGRYVLMPGDPGRCEGIARLFDSPQKVMYNREYLTYTGTIDGVKVSVTSTGIGGPSASIAMQELSAIGADTFIRVGTGGSLNPRVRLGDAVIASGAIRMEGTSKEYMQPEFPAVASFEVVNALEQAAQRHFDPVLGLRHHVGIVKCKDAYYGQHEPERMGVEDELFMRHENYVRGSAIAGEMESATLFVVASVLHVRCGAIFMIGNNVRGSDEQMNAEKEGESQRRYYGGHQRVNQIAIDAIRLLIQRDAKENGGKL